MAKVLKTENEIWGFWGTSERNGWDMKMSWEAAFIFLSERFSISSEKTRDLLDSRFGRHLSDDLSFIKSPLTTESITAHLKARFAADRADWTHWAYTEIAALNA